MLKGLILLFVFVFLGECLVRFFSLIIPAPVIGMGLLFIFLVVKGGSFESLDSAVSTHLRYLPLLFIPVAMGIITQFEIIKDQIWIIAGVLIFTTIISLIVSAKLMDYLISKKKSQS